MIVHIDPSTEGVSESHGMERFVMPPDKSILHRVLLIGAITQTSFTIPLVGQKELSHDIIATILALESLGVPIELFTDRIEMQGVGIRGLRSPSHIINCANSGTTARLLIGLLAGQDFVTGLSGDDSLSMRPMKRLTSLLVEQMAADIHTMPEGTLPAVLQGKPLEAAEIDLLIPSAQIKSAILLAGIFASGTTTIFERVPTRDHTERMLASFGYPIEVSEEGRISITGGTAFGAEDEVVYEVPGDISSASFIIVAAALLRRDIEIENVLVNPSRTRFLEILTLMGVETLTSEIVESYGEERGLLSIFGSKRGPLSPIALSGEDIPLLIDELPLLAVLSAFAEGESTISGASELRIKESDRIKLIVRGLLDLGVDAEESEDGLVVRGPGRITGGVTISHGGDHRIAMALSVAALLAEERVTIPDADVVKVSYPAFFSDLGRLAGPTRLRVDSERGASGV